MRRKDREITDFSKMLEVLSSCDCCRLGLTDEGQAYIVPMNFGYEAAGGSLILYFHSAGEGRKIRLIPRQDTVSFEADCRHALIEGGSPCAFSYRYQSVMGTGKLELLSGQEAKIHGLEKIMEHYTNASHWDFRPEMVERAAVLRLTVLDWSCKMH